MVKTHFGQPRAKPKSLHSSLRFVANCSLP
nr:MAG TPA: hypothetical protein [Caudoviricetes sp.]